MMTSVDAAPGNSRLDRVTRPFSLPRLIPWLALAAIFAVAILLRQWIPLNTDVSWLLVVGERVLDGQRLYRDIVEINPPMAVLAYLPGIVLARAIGVDPRHVIDAEILLLAALSLFLTSRILRRSPFANDLGWPLLIWSAAVLTIMPLQVFGQREHIATLTLLPSLALWALRWDKQAPRAWAILVAGFGAGITLAFKPFFAVPIALCVIVATVATRRWRVLLAPDNVIAVTLVAGFSVWTYLAYPDYFSLTYPIVRDSYLSWSMPLSVIFINPATMIGLIAAISVCLARQRRPLNPATWITLVASAGFAVSFYLQRRGWSYHSFPMVSLALLAMGQALTLPRTPLARGGVIAAFAVLAMTFLVGCQWFYANVDIGPVEAAVSGLKRHPKILVLSGEAAIGHPLVRNIYGTWVSRQENLWIREFVRLTREDHAVDPATDARLKDYLALERRWLIEDFRNTPPDIVLIDNLRDQWGDWARADAEITDLLKPYRLVTTVRGIDVLSRVESAPRPPG